MNVKKLLKQAQFHGLNKLDDVKCRWVWIASLFLLLIAASNIGAILVLRFLEHPTYIVRLEEGRSIMEFPSVQLCPQVNYPDYKVELFLSQLNIPDTLNVSYIKSVIQQLATFYSPDVYYRVEDLTRLEFLLRFNNLDVYTAAKSLTVSCEETLIRCRLLGQMKNCSELFKLELSQYSFCCVFNGRSLRREILDYGVQKVMPKVEYSTPFTGYESSLVIAVNQSTQPVNIDLDYKWISVDGGHAYIDASMNGTPVSPGREMWLGHKNEGFHIDQSAANLHSGLRGCQLYSEHLTLFPVYHKKYCQLECEIWYLLRRCRCALLAHPVPARIPTCNARYMPCAKHALEYLRVCGACRVTPGQVPGVKVRFNKAACHCVQTCDVPTDHVETSSFQLIHHTAYLDPFYEDLDVFKTSVLRVFIVKREVKTKSRRSYYSYEDLFGQLGGIFNVFFGCSLLSVLEIAQIIKYMFVDWIQRRRNRGKYLRTKKEGIKNTKGLGVTFKNDIMKRNKSKKVTFR